MSKDHDADAIERLRDHRAQLSDARSMLERTKRRINRIEKEVLQLRAELANDIIKDISSYVHDQRLRAQIATVINKHIREKFDEQRSIH